MSRRIVCGCAVVAAFCFAATAQSAKPYNPPKTAWGDPDLQGVWTGTSMIGTPVQRPANFGDRTVLTEQEFAQREARRKGEEEFDTAEKEGAITRCDPKRGGLGNTPETCSNGVSIGPPLYWQDRGTPNRQASLVVDPPDGRIPPLTAEAQKRIAELAVARRGHGPADSYKDRSMWERCITRGAIGLLPTGYNNGNEIVQAPGYVVLRIEMIHDTRVIPLDGRPHEPPAIRSFTGDSRGHFEGNTLVVETTNFTPETNLNNTPVSEDLKLIERFTRVGPDTVDYRVTVDDPKTWTRPWTMEFPLRHEGGYKLYEYACHEANYFMYDALTGARKQEQAAAGK
jgi:hypothetical protein